MDEAGNFEREGGVHMVRGFRGIEGETSGSDEGEIMTFIKQP